MLGDSLLVLLLEQPVAKHERDDDANDVRVQAGAVHGKTHAVKELVSMSEEAVHDEDHVSVVHEDRLKT